MSKHKRERPIELPKATPQKVNISEILTDIKERSKTLDVLEDLKTKTPKLRADKLVQKITQETIEIQSSDDDSDLELQVVDTVEKVEDEDEAILREDNLPNHKETIPIEEQDITNVTEVEKIHEEKIEEDKEKLEEKKDAEEEEVEEKSEEIPVVEKSLEPSVEITFDISKEKSKPVEPSVEVSLPSVIVRNEEEKENESSLNEEYSGNDVFFLEEKESDDEDVEEISTTRKSFNLKDLPRFKHHRGLVMSTISQSITTSQDDDVESEGEKEEIDSEEERISERMEKGYKIRRNKETGRESITPSLSILPSFHEEEDRSTFQIQKNEPKKRKREMSRSNLAVKFAQNYKKDENPLSMNKVKPTSFQKQKPKKKKKVQEEEEELN